MKKNLCAALIALTTATGIGLVTAEPSQAEAPRQTTTVSQNGTVDQSTTARHRARDAKRHRHPPHRTPMPPTKVTTFSVHGSW